jgi:hypothetical protein
MTTHVPFCFVDVFAIRPLTGNPLSLVTEADSLAEPQMHAIAREFNQSETTFLLRPSLPGRPGAGPLVARLVASGQVAEGSTAVVEQGHVL